MVSKNQCNLIDIRDIRELEKEGRVENSQHIPRGMLEFWLDPESIYFKEGKLDLEKEMVLFCAGGLRSALAAKSLLASAQRDAASGNGMDLAFITTENGFTQLSETEVSELLSNL